MLRIRLFLATVMTLLAVTAQAQIPYLVKDITTTGTSASSNPGLLAVAGGTLFFSAFVDGYGLELWVSDGTAAGTMMVKDINVGSGNSSPNGFCAIGSTVYFVAAN